MSYDRSDHKFIAIDLKSFYASVECRQRGLDALRTNLVVADPTRTEKTICLAVTPSLKAYGIPGRARLFEVVEKVREINAIRKLHARGGVFSGKSCDAGELGEDPALELDYIVAPPQMKKYMEYSTEIFGIYMRYVAPEDIHVYSVDEIFADVTHYLDTYHMTARELTMKMIAEVYSETGITATAGIGTNMYLAKIAMDIVAKHMEPDERGARIAELDEHEYRRQLWSHRPLTDFWRVGRGISRKLESQGLYTMGDVARCSLGTEQDYYNEELLYKMFGINAELLIDHAWGWENVKIDDIKSYKPENNSISTGQVLKEPYDYEKTRLIVKEMADILVLDLVKKHVVTDQIVLTIGYDVKNILDEKLKKDYKGEVVTDWYGREIPKHAHGTINLGEYTSSTRTITKAVLELYDRIMDPDLLSRRLSIAACRVLTDKDAERKLEEEESFHQMDLFADFGDRSRAEEKEKEKEEERVAREKEKRIQEAVLAIKNKYGKNAILKGMNLEEGATAMERNAQVGGHKA
ncbi:MAG: DNA methylase [Lachnospiraceae bacterium]|nr:DNA methylase [Lachnospiraceae bacterium]